MAISSLTDLVRDWDAGNITSGDGNGVGTWPDASSNGVDAVQGTAGSQPVLAAGAVNGLPAVTFDGTDDYLTDANFPQNWDEPLTWYVVAKPTLGTDMVLFGGRRDYPTSLMLQVDGFANSGLVAVKGGTSTIGTSTNDVTEDWHVFTVTKSGGGSSSNFTVYVDGAEYLSATGGSAGGNWPGANIGAEYSSTSGTFYNPFKGQIARVVACSTEHNASTINSVLSELSSDYGISVSQVVSSAPVVTISEDGPLFVASTGTLALSATCSSSSATIAWTALGGGGGTFNPPDELSTTFTPGGAGSVSLNCTATDSNGSGFDLVVVLVTVPSRTTEYAYISDATGWTRTGGLSDADALSDDDGSTYLTSGNDPTGESFSGTLAAWINSGAGQDATLTIKCDALDAESGSLTATLKEGNTVIWSGSTGTLPAGTAGQPVSGTRVLTVPAEDLATITDTSALTLELSATATAGA